MTCRLEPAVLRQMWPRAPRAKIDSICEISQEVFFEFGVDDYNVVAELMGNISHENGGGTIIRESGAYSEGRISQIFGPGHSSARVTPEEAHQIAALPVSQRGPALFDRVYNLPKSPKLAKELGNHEPGDGWKYRGGGDLQLTGRGSYERIGRLTNHPEIVDNPDLLADPEISFRVAVAEFAALGCIPLAKAGQTERVRRKVNGGTNGMSEVVVWVRRWKRALPQLPDPVEPPRGADTGNKGLMQSKIMQGATATAVSVATGAGAKVAETANTDSRTVSVNDIADKVQQASDVISTVTVAKDNATAVVQTVKPFLGLAPSTWSTIAAIAITAAVVAIAFTMWERYKKMRDQGV